MSVDTSHDHHSALLEVHEPKNATATNANETNNDVFRKRLLDNLALRNPTNNRSDCDSYVYCIPDERRITIDHKKRFHCEVCGRDFCQRIIFEDHMNVHKGNKPHKCKICECGFYSRASRRIHEKNVHNII